MPICSSISRLFLLFFILASFMISGCGTMPWDKKKSDEDLVFEQEFEPTEEIDSELDQGPTDSREEDDFFADNGAKDKNSGKQDSKVKSPKSTKGEGEDFFFEDDSKVTKSISGEQPVVEEEIKVSDSKAADDFFEEGISSEETDELDKFIEEESAKTEAMSEAGKENGGMKTDSMEEVDSSGILEDTSGSHDDLKGFDSIDQKTDKEEIEVDIQILQNQQEALIQRVKELQRVIQDMEPRLTATQKRLETNLTQTSTGTQSLSPEIENLKDEITRLNEEIGHLKESGPVKQTKLTPRKPRVVKKKKLMGYHTPKEYNTALEAYRAGNYDDSLMLFQEYRLKSPPENLQDNVLFWLGNNYYKLGRFDEALSHFEAVLDQFPKGNKSHDSRFMMGVTLQKMGDTGRALDTLETALKKNPPADVRKKILEQLQEIK